MLKQKYSVTVEEYGITIETGTIAKQANGAITIQLGETTVFVAATAATKIREGQDFFPLQVDYREKFHAAGRMPGGFFKREGRPSEKEILTSRLTDRPLRPLFPKGFFNEVQVQALLMTADLVNEPDILLVNGASAALMCSDIPWNGPVGCIRVGLIDGEFIVNPTHEQQYESELDLIYVGNEKEMMMIEGSAEEVPEDTFIAALVFAQKAIQPIIAAQKELAKMIGKEKKSFDLFVVTDENLAFAREIVGERMAEAVFLAAKSDRQSAVDVLKDEVKAKMIERDGEENFDGNQLMLAFEVLQEEIYRQNILESGKRADGRSPTDLRPIECQVGLFPRVHGSALFQRGETQGIVFTTLGSRSDNQDMDGLTGGPKEKSFLLHYNFPNYSVGETGRIMGPGRREIGHGALAERSLLPVLPPEDEFPYTVRLVSEIMESNGSTSMASVCGGCLSLMDAGVPISDMVAGISTGLVTRFDKDGQLVKYVVLSDIIGAEDHFGDMDFKICGTKNGITGFQLDLKIQGLSHDIAIEAIGRNRDLRMQILEVMKATIDKPREELSPYAPRIETIQIDPEKIGLIIGPGGKTIRRICEVSGAEIDINEDNSGRIDVYATSSQSMQRAIDEIKAMTAEIEEGKLYHGTVRGVKDFGAFVECLPSKEGLVHVSELADFRVNHVEDVCALGDRMWVKCVGIDEKGRVRLSRIAALADRNGENDEISDKVAAAKEKAASEPPRERRERSDRGDRGDRGGDRGPRRQGDGGDRRRAPRRDRGEN
ncbi:MAG TPA: polyribonucleotide nucleotidyltransferase [Oceanipulchritudo sp.]|nr:polyribonucleotide nucleotidyltransferase [Oceanipulchritudo sp.]